MENLPENAGQEILSGRIVHPIGAYRDASGCTIHDAMASPESVRQSVSAG
ncbi:hypothetical protein O1L60_43990 [Streptomyces diastatochromogenes]|nr:hypothetical protein [Streptomyces diastatochromogenes]